MRASDKACRPITHRPQDQFVKKKGFWLTPKISFSSFGIKVDEDSACKGRLKNFLREGRRSASIKEGGTIDRARELWSYYRIENDNRR